MVYIWNKDKQVRYFGYMVVRKRVVSENKAALSGRNFGKMAFYPKALPLG